MPYYHVDPEEATNPTSLPDVEVFHSSQYDFEEMPEAGWYYAYGFPGCLWDSEPEGPFLSEIAALAAARGNE